MKKIYFLNLITFLSMIFVVSDAWIVPASQKGELPAEGPVKVRLGTALSVNNALIYIALDQRYFIEEGVSLELIPYDYAKFALDDLIAGCIDLTYAVETPFVMSSFEHRNFKLVATIGLYNNDPKIVARKDAGISNAADLKGKRIGTTGARQSAYFFLHVFLLEHGLKEEKALIKADNYLARKPDQAHKIVADKLDVSTEDITDLLEQLAVEVSLSQTMFLLLEDEARWAQNIGFFSGREIPNFLDFIYIDALEYIDPALVTVIH